MNDHAPMPTGKATDMEKGLAAIAYLGPLFIVSYLAANNSKFVKFHAAQGLTLFLVALVLRLLMGAVMMSSVGNWSYGYGMMWGGGMMLGGAGLLGVLMMIVNWALIILAIFGIIKAVQGEMWEMPVIGKWAKKFNF